jgi:hypothetical protein
METYVNLLQNRFECNIILEASKALHKNSILPLDNLVIASKKDSNVPSGCG